MKHFKKFASALISSIILLSFALTLPASASVLEDPELVSYVEEFMETQQAPGLSVTAVEGEEVSFLSRGYDSIARSVTADEHTHYELASVSKAFTGLSVHLLQQEGKLSITDSVTDYLPWLRVYWQGKEYDLKIWHLLYHTSGISEDETYSQVKPGTDESLKEETARLAQGADLGFEPGTDYEYCNLNYNILAWLVEVVSGERFEDYVTREIFVPLGMNDTGYDIPTAQGYQRFLWHTVEYDAPRFKGCQGDGYVISTASDMSRWIQAQLGQLELPDKLKNAIESSHELQEGTRLIQSGTKEDGTPLYYMNGWEQTKDGSFFEHSGGNPNFSTMLYIDKANGVGTFAAVNMLADLPIAAAQGAYSLMTDGDFVRHEPGPGYDDFASPLALGGLVLMAVLIVLLATQKKRLAKKPPNIKVERIRLVLRLLICGALLAFFVSVPYLLGQNYRTLLIWTPWTVTAALVILDLDFILMIVGSILRRIRQGKREA